MFGFTSGQGRAHRNIVASMLAVSAVLASTLIAATPAAAAVQTFHVAPSGSGTDCSGAVPCSIAAAQAKVREEVATADDAIVVSVGSGTYHLESTWSFGPADSGRDANHVVRWQAAAGATPLFTSAEAVTGWTPVGTTGVWKAGVPTGVTDSRQLYVDGERAIRARGPFNPAGFTKTPTGYTTTAGASLADYKNQSSVEVVLHQAWTYARCTVGSVSGTTVTMAQPCWDHNVKLAWPYGPPHYVENAFDLLNQPGEWYLDKTGDVAGDSTPAVYYKPRAGQALTGADAVSVTVPSVQTLLHVAGDGVNTTGTGARSDTKVRNLQFVGLTFADSTWLFPSSGEGFADTQANMTWTGHSQNKHIYDGHTKTPAAVTVAYAENVAIIGNTFTRLGAVGLDVAESSSDVTIEGNSVFDTSSNGINIGGISPRDQRPGAVNGTEKSTSTAGNSFSYTFAGNGIEFVTSTGPTRGTADIYIDDVLVEAVDCNASATRYQQTCASVHGLENPADPDHPETGVHTLKVVKTGDENTLSLDALRPYPSQASIDNTNSSITYVGSWTALTGQSYPDDAVHDITVRNNYVHDVALEFLSGVGIWAGYVESMKLQHNEVANVPYSGISLGWGWGYLDPNGGGNNGNEPPASVTIAANNEISGNFVHHFMLAGHDGGAVYIQSAQPNSVFTENYLANSPDAGGTIHGIYLDNGSEGFDISNNVVDRVASWALISDHYSPPYALNNALTDNWANTTAMDCCASSSNIESGNIDTIIGQAWPSGAQAVMNAAGLETSATDALGTAHDWAAELHAGLSTTNVASGATATASSEYSSGNSAAKAIDGSTGSRWSAASNTSTLTLTFPAVTAVDRVVWREAQHCCGGRIQDYTIDYWDGAVWKTVKSGSFPAISQTDTFSEVSTTKIRLNVVSAAGPATVSEFEAYNDDNNLANGRPATQSSDYVDIPAAVASRANDGNTDGNFYNNSVSHNNCEANGWWKVDLGSIKGVGGVEVYNRTDSFGNRLSDYWVLVSQNPFDGRLTAAQQATQPGVWSSHQTSQAGSPSTIPAGVAGRYVMVQQNGTNCLHLAEVRVLPKATPVITPPTNHAQGQTATQSSTYSTAAASRAVDGNTNGDYFSGSVTHTNQNANAWWHVDLGAAKSIAGIELWNRTDGNADRLSDYWVFVSTTPFNTALSPTQQASASGVVWSSHQVTQAGLPTLLTAGVTGRYVMVQLNGTNYLSIAEVKVMSP